MGDELILVGSEEGRRLGFTNDEWDPCSYLVKSEGYIYLSLIVAKRKGRGALKRLIKRILELGYGVKVPNVINPRLVKFLAREGFEFTLEGDSETEEAVEVWVKEPARGKRPHR